MLTRKSPAGGQGSDSACPSADGRGEITRSVSLTSPKIARCAVVLLSVYRRRA